MSKFIKKVICTLLVCQTFIVTSVFAESNQDVVSVNEYSNSVSDKNVNSEAREIFLNSLPQEERDVLDISGKEIVEESYSFYKFELKDEAKGKDQRFLSEEDYNIVPSSLEEFKLANTINFRNQVAPGVWEKNDFDSIVMTGITAIRDNNDNRRFSVTTNFTWSQSPSLKFTDAVGITCGTNISPEVETRKGYARAKIEVAENAPIYTDLIEEGPIVDPQGRGVAMSIKPLPAATYNTGYVKCDFRFQGEDDDFGVFTSEYLKSSIQLGSLSFDTSGRPSLGLVIGAERFSNAINVSKK